MKENYQLQMEAEIQNIPENTRPTLLLQCCCAPCSSYVLSVLAEHFDVLVYYYNPNIHPESEYQKRGEQFKKLFKGGNYETKVRWIPAEYDPERFFDAVKGLENEPEGGARCTKCFWLRLRETVKKAKELGADYFTTTLSVSPHKNAQALNEIGIQLEKEYGVKFLRADFKKKEGYKQSIVLSREYDLYRQDYCGCIFSMRPEEKEALSTPSE